MSTPFWVSGSAAMKMMSSTSSTSMSGVTFMSALACGVSPRDDPFGAVVLVRVRHGYLPPAGRRRRVLLLGDERDVLDLRLAQRVHRVHDRRCSCASLSPLRKTIFSFLSSRTRLHAGGEARSVATWRRVDAELVLASRSRRPSGPACPASRAVLLASGSCDRHALLQHRRDQHHDDEQHQHDVDERRDVDVGLEAAFGAANIHCHRTCP